MSENQARVPLHPGETLRQEIAALALSASALARRLAVPASRITEIVQGKRSITPDTALRLARYFGTSPRFWLELQLAHDLSASERRSGAQIRRLVQPLFSLHPPETR